jgi:hypothetical protein
MKDIKQFLIEHPILSIRAIEQQLNIPLGTIRIKGERSIPDKFIMPLSELLTAYGYNNHVQTSVKEDKVIVQTSDSHTILCEATKLTSNFIRRDVRIYDRYEIPIGTKYNIIILS